MIGTINTINTRVHKRMNGNTVFTVNYTYDANGKVINISCTQN